MSRTQDANPAGIAVPVLSAIRALAYNSAMAIDGEVASSDVPEVARPIVTFAARVGTFLLDCDSHTVGPDVYRALTAALHADPRVIQVDPVEPVPPMSPNAWPLYKAYRSYDIDRPFTAMMLAPIAFSVEVPTKNQRAINGSPVPSESYYAVWDGLTLVVAWDHRSPDHVTTISGGHVAGEVIKDAARAAGMAVVSQGCTPMCEYELNHTTLLVEVVDRSKSHIRFGPLCNKRQLHIEVRPYRSKENTFQIHVLGLYYDLRQSCRYFALMKNYGLQADEVFRAASQVADRLLVLQRQRATAFVGTIKDRLMKRVGTRGWRAKSRVLIADLWLHIARIEYLRRRWSWYRDSFEEEVGAIEADDLFASDYRTEASDLERLSVAPLLAEVQYAAERLDNRDVVVVTSIATLAGAVAGFLAGLFG